MARNKTVKQLSVKFEGDTKGLNTAINQATKVLKDIDKAINTLDKNFEKFGTGSSIEEQVEKFDLLQKKIEEGNKALKELKDFQKQLDNESDNNKLTSAYQNLKLKISEVEKGLEEAKLQQDKFNNSNLSKILATYAKIKNKVLESNEQFSQASSYINVLNKALDYTPNSVELLNAKALALKTQMETVNGEVISLSRYLSELKNQGVSETSKEFLEVSNTIAGLKEKYASLKAETVAYQQALSSANKLQADMASRGAALREALSIDPKNEVVIRQYTTYLAQELEKAETVVKNTNLAMNEMPKSVNKTSQEYINLTSQLVKAEETIKRTKLEQDKWKESSRTFTDTLDKANNVLNETRNKAQILKESLELDPTNLSKASEYCDYLDKSSDRCQRQINNLNEQLKKMDSGKVKKTEESYNKAKSTVNALTKQLKIFEEEQKKLSPEAIKYNNQLKNLKSSLSNMDRVAKVLKESLELDPGNVEKQTLYTNYLKSAINDCEHQQQELNAQINKLDVSNADILNGKYVELSEALSTILKLSKGYREELGRINGESQNASIGTNNLVSDFAALNNILPAIERNLTKVTTSLFNNAKSYETNIASIRKVVKDLSDDTVDDLKQIATSTGNTFESISAYATLGATLGIAEKDLSKFTKAMVDLEVASDKAITGEEGAARVARLLNQFKIGADYAENFGSSVTYVGDQFAATANEILETASYMGGLSAVNNVTIHDLIGMASEMKNLGVESASGASAISKTFLKINTQVATCGKDLEQFAQTAGMTSEQFTKAWEQAPTDAFLSFINGLSTKVFDEINSAVNYGTSSLEGYATALGVSNDEFERLWKLDPEGTFGKYKDALGDLEEGSVSASVTLEDLKLSGVRVAQTLLKMAGNGDVVREAIKDSNKAWNENTNLVRKANEMYDTTEGKLNQAKESISQAAAALGDELLPMAKTAADVTKNMAIWFGKLPKPIKTTSGVVLMLSAGLGKLLTTASKASISLSLLENSSGALGTAVKGVTSKLASGGGLISVLGTALPVALGVAGAGLIAYAGYSAYANNETIKYNKTMKELCENASQQFVTSLQGINSEMANINEIVAIVQETTSNLDLNPDGKVDTTSDKYKFLQEKIAELNSYLGSEFQISIDETTGKFYNQNGVINDLQESMANYRLEAERQAWLTANQEIYNENLKVQNEQEKKLLENLTLLNEQREAYKQLGTQFSDEELNSFFKAAEGMEDVSKWSKEAQEKYELFKQTIVNNDSKVQDALKAYGQASNLYKDANEIVTQFNQIETAPIESVKGLIDSLTSNAQKIVFDYDSQNLDSCYQTLDNINKEIIAAQELASNGIDMSKHLEDLNAWKQQVEGDIKTIESMRTEANKNVESMSDAMTTFAEENGLIVDAEKAKWLEENGFFPSMERGAAKAVETTLGNLKLINDYKIEDKSFTITEYKRQVVIGDWGTGTKKSRGSGGFGNVPNLTIPTLRSGGYNQVTLNAKFQINNNGSTNITKEVTQKIGKDLVNYINEELGRSI